MLNHQSYENRYLLSGRSEVKKQVGKKLSIYSPGVGTQGGNANEVISVGADYLIVGRSILNAKNPIDAVKNLQLQSFGK